MKKKTFASETNHTSQKTGPARHGLQYHTSYALMIFSLSNNERKKFNQTTTVLHNCSNRTSTPILKPRDCQSYGTFGKQRFFMADKMRKNSSHSRNQKSDFTQKRQDRNRIWHWPVHNDRQDSKMKENNTKKRERKSQTERVHSRKSKGYM